MLNKVVLIGYVSQPPRKVVTEGKEEYFFPLAVYRDSDKPTPRRADGKAIPDFPPVKVFSRKGLPDFVRHKNRIRVEGWIRTRNVTEPLPIYVGRALRKAGVDGQTIKSVLEQVPANLKYESVVVEIVAEKIFPEQKLSEGSSDGRE